jgi:hypothetical protein
MSKFLITLDEVKKILAKKYKTTPKCVDVYNGLTISIGGAMWGEDVEENDPLFEIDTEQ